MSLWINEKVEQEIFERQAVHGAAPIFPQEKEDKIRIRPLVHLTARNEITMKDDENNPKTNNDPELARKREIPKRD